MLTVGIRELKTNPSIVLKRVRLKGETIAITFRGEEIARISPVKLAETVDGGWLRLIQVFSNIVFRMTSRMLLRKQRRLRCASLPAASACNT